MPLPRKKMRDLSDSDKARFHDKVERRGRGKCWEWNASLFPKGYGRFAHHRRTLKAHRVAYWLSTGLDPFDRGETVLVCHTCNNPRCCNPAHLYLDDHRGNQRFKIKSERQRAGVGERNSHAKLTVADVLRIRRSSKTTVELAKRYGIHQGGISGIQTGKTWRCVGGPIRKPKRTHDPSTGCFVGGSFGV